MKAEHKERSDLNKKHGIVRHISEALGGNPGPLELANATIETKKHPERGTVEEQLEALTHPYPSLEQWKPAGRFL